MNELNKIYAQFLREKEYLNGLSPKTIRYYRWTFNRWDALINELPDALNIKEFVIKLKESGISSYTINSYIRGMNSLFSWMAENDFSEPFKIKKIKESQSRAFVVYNYEEKSIQILEITQASVQRAMKIKIDNRHGEATSYDFIVTREGEGMLTEYDIDTGDKGSL